ncbi:MAG: S8 family serine peptidase [Candidatus Zixiibacteriota bacterium]
MKAPRTSLIALLVFILCGQLLAVDDILTPAAITRAKETGNQIEAVKTFLRPRLDDGTVKVWVYFTDKGVNNQAEFQQKAAAVTLTDETLGRRKKMGLDHITFLDLPVEKKYVNAITARGPKVKRVSRWLNAASFYMTIEQIDEINQLPFVAKIRPVAAFSKERVTESQTPPEPVYIPTDKDASFLNYGTSLGQLQQINVPVVHDKGHNGEGVIVAMLDTGYRKDHEAFASAFTDGRVLAEWDFVFDDGNTQNELEDVSDQHRHGTLTWSTLGGAKSGEIYGPAYGASFILAKTEDVRSETPVEEDNWAAAVEWADSIGADVISSSLGYSDWYTYSDFDGETATITIAANLAADLGIVVVTSMGNEGPSSGTLTAPSDAFESISVGAVSSTRTIASFSSRGPSFDGRTKPEVVAQGVSTYCASPTTTTSYTFANGTSLSCPLAGGCAAVILGMRPEFTPALVRRAMIETADQASSPDNNYGWGLIDLDAALHWGAKISSDVTAGQAPLTVNFADSSTVDATGWAWSLGDGDSSFVENPIHEYTTPGLYTVGLTIQTAFGNITTTEEDYIVVLADTLTFSTDTVYAGQQSAVEVNLTNSQELISFTITVDFSQGSVLSLDSMSTAGTRSEGYTTSVIGTNTAGTQQAIRFTPDGTPLAPGSGPIMILYFDTDEYAFGPSIVSVDTVTVAGKSLELTTNQIAYQPFTNGGGVFIHDVIRGDANNDGTINIGDPVYLISYIFKGGEAPITIESADANFDFSINIGDAVYLVNYIFRSGPPPNDI